MITIKNREVKSYYLSKNTMSFKVWMLFDNILNYVETIPIPITERRAILHKLLNNVPGLSYEEIDEMEFN